MVICPHCKNKNSFACLQDYPTFILYSCENLNCLKTFVFFKIEKIAKEEPSKSASA